MKKRYDYSNYAYKKEKRNHHASASKSHKNYKRVTILISVVILISGGVLIFFQRNKSLTDVAVVAKTFYAVSVGHFDQKQHADVYAKSIFSRGGAGFILPEKGFFVLAVVFKSDWEAKSVVKKLEQADETATVFEIKIPSTVVKFRGTRVEGEAVKAGLKVFEWTLLSMMELSQDFDAKRINSTDLMLLIGLLKEEVEEHIVEVASMKHDEKREVVTVLLESMRQLSTKIEKTSLQATSQLTKKSVCEILDDYKTLLYKLSQVH